VLTLTGMARDMSESAVSLVVEELRAGYGTMEVVSSISVRVSSGELVSIVGRNGAGKTTSLLAIAGLRYGDSSGTVTLGGVDLSRATPKQIVRAGISLVPEGHRIFKKLTVANNLKLGAYHRRRVGKATLEASRERVFEIFPILLSYIDRNAGLLSGGEQQMVAIGQALMANPTVLILDEPTSGLALPVIRTIMDALDKLRDSGLAILMVEQSVPRALKSSDRCYVMDQGRIVMEGDSALLSSDERVLNIVRGTYITSEDRDEHSQNATSTEDPA
jgi:branched-chain amino acid transport system ATP-binding protein